MLNLQYNFTFPRIKASISRTASAKFVSNNLAIEIHTEEGSGVVKIDALESGVAWLRDDFGGNGVANT